MFVSFWVNIEIDKSYVQQMAVDAGMDKVNESYTIMTAQSESSRKVVRGRGVESAEDEEKG